MQLVMVRPRKSINMMLIDAQRVWSEDISNKRNKYVTCLTKGIFCQAPRKDTVYNTLSLINKPYTAMLGTLIQLDSCGTSVSWTLLKR